MLFKRLATGAYKEHMSILSRVAPCRFPCKQAFSHLCGVGWFVEECICLYERVTLLEPNNSYCYTCMHMFIFDICFQKRPRRSKYFHSVMFRSYKMSRYSCTHHNRPLADISNKLTVFLFSALIIAFLHVPIQYSVI